MGIRIRKSTSSFKHLALNFTLGIYIYEFLSQFAEKLGLILGVPPSIDFDQCALYQAMFCKNERVFTDTKERSYVH